MATALTGIKHGGKLIEAGTEVSKEDFGDEVWATLVEAGAVEDENFQVSTEAEEPPAQEEPSVEEEDSEDESSDTSPEPEEDEEE